VRSPILRSLIQVILLAAAYLAAAAVGLMGFAVEPARVATAVWPASGIALAAILLLGTRVWPGVWLGALLANGMNALVALAVSGGAGEPGWLGDALGKMPHVSLAAAAAIATGNTCEALLAAWFCRRWNPRAETPFQRVEDVLQFAVAAGCGLGVDRRQRPHHRRRRDHPVRQSGL
jgi:integral membrane sensor domain MASE1